MNDVDLRDKIIETHTDVKHLVEWSKQHTEDDNRRFKSVTDDIEWGKKIVYGGVGIIAAFEIIMKFVK